MKIAAIELENIRGFKTLPKTDLSKSLNVFVGENNSGKSTLLSTIHLLQNQSALTANDRTKNEVTGSVTLYSNGTHLENVTNSDDNPRIQFLFPSDEMKLMRPDSEVYIRPYGRIEPRYPVNLIYPYLSNRKVAAFSEGINNHVASGITGDFTYLYAKIDDLRNQSDESLKLFNSVCDKILHIPIHTKSSGGGKHAGYSLDMNSFIPLTSMGAGVANLLGLIVELCIAENQIFIVEEPENDIHPKALKALLDLIIEKSTTNQFFISTHSNIVVRQLGAQQDTKIFHVTSKLADGDSKLFISSLKEINTPQERQDVLEDMGYELFDLGLRKGWLFLEESSAQMVIENLIKWFFRNELLGTLGVFSCQSVDKVAQKFDNFLDLVKYIHLGTETAAYKNKIWVMVDSGGTADKVIKDLKNNFKKANGWKEDRFQQFSKHDFEEFYPPEFPGYPKIVEILAMVDKDAQREAKIELTKELRVWIEEKNDDARNAFEKSAKEVLAKLRDISEKLKYPSSGGPASGESGE